MNEQLEQHQLGNYFKLEELVSFALNYLGQSLCSFYLTRWRCLWQISIFVAWIALEIGNCRVNRKEKMINFASWLWKIYNFSSIKDCNWRTGYLLISTSTWYPDFFSAFSTHSDISIFRNCWLFSQKCGYLFSLFSLI